MYLIRCKLRKLGSFFRSIFGIGSRNPRVKFIDRSQFYLLNDDNPEE